MRHFYIFDVSFLSTFEAELNIRPPTLKQGENLSQKQAEPWLNPFA